MTRETPFLRWWRDANAMRFALRMPALSGGAAWREFQALVREDVR